MATYAKRSAVSGKWADKPSLYDMQKGLEARIVSETNPVPSTYKDAKGNDQEQDVCKVQFDDADPVNVALNRATIEGLVDAFGGESKNWQGHKLSVEIDKLPGKKYPLYLIPEGYKRIEDANGYSVITKADADDIPVINLDEEPSAPNPL